MVEMANIIQPRDNIFFTDGSVAGGRSSAAFTHHGYAYLLRLSNNASIMQAELTAIHAALSRGLHSPSRCVVFTDSKSTLPSLMQHHPNDNVSILRGIRDVLLLLSTHTSMVVWRCPSILRSDGASSSGFLTRI